MKVDNFSENDLTQKESILNTQEEKEEGKKFLLLFFSFIIWVTGWCSGYYLGSVSQIALLMGKEMAWNDQERQIFIGLMFVFSIFGALFTPSAANLWGRKPILIIILISFSLSSFLTSISVDFSMSLVSRFIAGCAIGGSQVMTSLYPIELTSHSSITTSWRGLFVIGNEVLLNLGIVLGALAAYISTLPSLTKNFEWIVEEMIYPIMKLISIKIPENDGSSIEQWRVIPWIGQFPSLIGLVLVIFFLPESPYYILLRRYHAVKSKAHVFVNFEKETSDQYKVFLESSGKSGRSRRLSSILIQKNMIHTDGINYDTDQDYSSSNRRTSDIRFSTLYEDEENGLTEEDSPQYYSSSFKEEDHVALLDYRKIDLDFDNDIYLRKCFKILSTLYYSNIDYIIDDINKKIYWEQHKHEIDQPGEELHFHQKFEDKYSLSKFNVSPESKKLLLIIFVLASMHQLTGLSIIDNYTPDLLKQIGIFSTKEEFGILMLLNSTKFCFALMSSLVVDKVGRRPILLLSTFVCVITLITTSILQFRLSTKRSNPSGNEIDSSSLEYFYISLLCVWNAFFSLGIGPLTWLSISELSPAVTFRSNIISLAICWNRVLCAAINLTALTMLNCLGNFYLLIYVAFSTFGGIYLYLNFPESKGKDIQDIKYQLQKTN